VPADGGVLLKARILGEEEVPISKGLCKTASHGEAGSPATTQDENERFEAEGKDCQKSAANIPPAPDSSEMEAEGNRNSAGALWAANNQEQQEKPLIPCRAAQAEAGFPSKHCPTPAIPR